MSELDELVSKNCEYCDTGEFEVEGGVRYIFEVVIESKYARVGLESVGMLGSHEPCTSGR